MVQHQRAWIVGVLVAALCVATVGVAAAGISSGNYSFERQRCSGFADDSDDPSHVEPGCRNATVSVEDGNGTEGLGLGLQQTADGQAVSEATPTVAAPQDMDLTSGLSVYAGADDNLDEGEHDSSPVLHDGPSDGGAIELAASPESLQNFLAAVLSADTQYLMSHPVPFLIVGLGSCADGICESIQTQRQVAYQGGDPHHTRDVADYAGHEWDPATCAGPTDTAADCGHDGIGYWHQNSPTTYVEPGIQIYEDPSPEGSPIGPYPLPAVAVTTCGIYIGGGILALPASPLTNSAGQLAISTGC